MDVFERALYQRQREAYNTYHPLVVKETRIRQTLREQLGRVQVLGPRSPQLNRARAQLAITQQRLLKIENEVASARDTWLEAHRLWIRVMEYGQGASMTSIDAVR